MAKIKINNPKIGSDPEAFLWSDEKQKVVPVCGLVGGTKNEPLIITKEGHALQEDGVAVEFCIPPANTADEFVENINFMKNYINDTVIAKYNLKIKCVGSARFEQRDLLDPKANEFGCDPDFNAWTYEQNEIKRDDLTLRGAGFHIHVGYDNPDNDVSFEIARAMDLYVTLPSILIDPDTLRRQLYGKAGACRLKPYGVENRTLSSFMMSTDDLIRWVFNSTMDAVNFVNNDGKIEHGNDIIYAINNSDKDAVMDILNHYNVAIPNNNLILS